MQLLPLMFLVLICSCVPDFAPEISLKKTLSADGADIEWYHVRGILDQNFPEYIVIKRGSQTDTLCRAHNIADICVSDHIVTVGFYGQPKKFNYVAHLPDSMMRFKIVQDSCYIMPDPKSL